MTLYFKRVLVTDVFFAQRTQNFGLFCCEFTTPFLVVYFYRAVVSLNWQISGVLSSANVCLTLALKLKLSPIKGKCITTASVHCLISGHPGHELEALRQRWASSDEAKVAAWGRKPGITPLPPPVYFRQKRKCPPARDNKQRLRKKQTKYLPFAT